MKLFLVTLAPPVPSDPLPLAPASQLSFLITSHSTTFYEFWMRFLQDFGQADAGGIVITFYQSYKLS